jgi:outer membrane protein assembly factor BamE
MILRTTLISHILSITSRKDTYNPVLLGLFSVLLLSGCASWLPDAHRIDLQQGNTVKLEQLENIEIGMTKTEVRRIMGSPMLSDPFHNQRWDYIYRFIPNKGFERKSLLTLYFENDTLIRIDDSEYVEP